LFFRQAVCRIKKDQQKQKEPQAMEVKKNRNYWLMKSEPKAFSIDDLKNSENSTACWDGVRNYQARNFLRDEIKAGDGVLFYHSNIAKPAIVGLAEVVREGYPDHTALDPNSDHYDPKATKDNPRWYMVDIRFLASLPEPIDRKTMAADPVLSGMEVMKKGSRLSVQPVTSQQWQAVLQNAGMTDPFF
jgi:predicted RNA-binding protein with PUA-like domain